MHIKIVAVGRVKEPGFVLAQEGIRQKAERYVQLEIIEVDEIRYHQEFGNVWR